MNNKKSGYEPMMDLGIFNNGNINDSLDQNTDP